MPLAAGLCVAAGMGHAQEAGWKLSGHYKNLAVASRTLQRESFTLDLNRFRLEAAGHPAPSVAVDLQYDNEVLLGSYLRTRQFFAQKDMPPPQYWRAESNTLERGDVYARHRLHRASATWSVGAVDLKLGRQRIAWGTGRFWSPLDLLNPVDPLAIEREERPGVDAAVLEAKLGALSRLSLVVAPQRGEGRSNHALQWHGNTEGVDYSLMGGHLRGQDVAGLDIATQFGATGVRAELAWQRPAGGAAFQRAMLGADHAFANTLTLSAELYYDGAGHAARAARHAGLYASYEITPLLKWTTYAVLNADDHSHALDSRLLWSLQTDLDLSVGVQRFRGARTTQYGRLHNVVMVQLQWFFSAAR